MPFDSQAAMSWRDYFDLGGPLMYAVLAAWIVVLAGVIGRGFYALGRAMRRPGVHVRALAAAGDLAGATRAAKSEGERARRGVERIDSVSQLATSIGLFGTVVGLAQGFLGRGAQGGAGGSLEAISDGLSTALFTTIFGLCVFLFGQVVLVLYREWLALLERDSVASSIGEGRP